MTIPQKLDREFLEWLRSRTEATWAKLPHLPSDGWQPGTRWAKPLSEAEISTIEKKLGLTFPPDYRLFLNTLHTTDRPPLARKWLGGVMKLIKGNSELVEGVGFRDWRAEDGIIRERLTWPLQGLEAREGFRSAPKLVPVFGHRFLLADPCEAGNPVLSIYGDDIITYGVNLRGYLLNELFSSLGLTEVELQKDQDSQTEKVSLAQIPFWGAVSGEESSA